MDQDSTALEPARIDPANPDEAAAYLLALAMGDPALTQTKALEAQRQRVAALRDPTASASLDELARQIPLLQALFMRFSAEALRVKSPDSKAKLLRAALQAQQAHARTFALLRGLALQANGLAAVALEESPDDDTSSGHGAER